MTSFNERLREAMRQAAIASENAKLKAALAAQPERKPMTRERRNVIINDAEKSALPTRQSAAYAIDETERYHGIKP